MLAQHAIVLTVQYSDEVLSCFASYRLDDVKVSQRKLEQQQVSEQSYFAKYLTSEKVRQRDCHSMALF